MQQQSQPTSKPPIILKYEAWEKGGQHAQLLYQMIKNGTIPHGWTPKQIIAEFPQYQAYNPANFRSTVSRYRRRVHDMIEAKQPDCNMEADNMYNNTTIEEITNRSTPATMTPTICDLDAGVPVINTDLVGITPTPRHIRFSDKDMLFFINKEHEEEEEDISTIEKYKEISVSASESQYVYGCTTYEIVLPYECYTWSDPVVGSHDWRDHVTVNVWLLSIADVTTVTANVSNCGNKLEVRIKLPSILNYKRLDERNSKIYVSKRTGEPMYPSTHVRSIAQKKAIASLPSTRNGEVYLTQSIYLPFKVSKKIDSCNGYPGVDIKCYEKGTIKQLVVELVSASNNKLESGRSHQNLIDDNMSFANCTRVNTVPTNRSVYSLNIQTGKPRSSTGPPGMEVHVGVGNSTASRNSFTTNGTSTSFYDSEDTSTSTLSSRALRHKKKKRKQRDSRSGRSRTTTGSSTPSYGLDFGNAHSVFGSIAGMHGSVVGSVGTAAQWSSAGNSIRTGSVSRVRSERSYYANDEEAFSADENDFDDNGLQNDYV